MKGKREGVFPFALFLRILCPDLLLVVTLSVISGGRGVDGLVTGVDVLQAAGSEEAFEVSVGSNGGEVAHFLENSACE